MAKLAGVVAAVTVATLATGTPAAAAPVVSGPIVEGLATPLSLSVDKGNLFIGLSIGGHRVIKVDRKGNKKQLVNRPGVDVVGVEAAGPGLLFTVTGRRNGERFAKLKQRQPDGTVRSVANLLRHEREHNPDGDQLYGFRHLSRSCAAKVPDRVGGEPYRGIRDSHPYAVLRLPNGQKIVADAGGNDLVRVGRQGRVSTLAVLPTRPMRVTAQDARNLPLPTCTIGERYHFEFVPTDVERGPNGMLYVTSLPGGPEDPSLGARGSVWRVNPVNGRMKLVAKGFAGPTNLAVSARGRIYVTELFGDRLSTIRTGVRRTVVSLPQPSAAEWAGGRLYVTTHTFGNGSVVTVTP